MVVNFIGLHNPIDVTKGMYERWKNTPMPEAHGNDVNTPDAIFALRQNYAALIENIDQ